MIVPKHVGEQVDIKTPEELFNLIHDVSMYLIIDDKHDLGKFQYYGREDHYYHGKHSPDHPSPFHHWQVGVIGLIISQLGSLMTKAQEMYTTFKAVETGDYSGIDSDILEIAEDEDSTISLEDYKNEVSSFPLQNDKEEKTHHEYEGDYSSSSSSPTASNQEQHAHENLIVPSPKQHSVSSAIAPSSSSQVSKVESSLNHTLIRPQPKPLLLF